MRARYPFLFQTLSFRLRIHTKYFTAFFTPLPTSEFNTLKAAFIIAKMNAYYQKEI